MFVSVLYSSGGFALELKESKDIFVPAVAGWGVVASGLGLIMGASDGCGGGVARCRSSFRIYVPAIAFSECSWSSVRHMYLLQPLIEMPGQQDATGCYSSQPWGRVRHFADCTPPGTDILGEVVAHCFIAVSRLKAQRIWAVSAYNMVVMEETSARRAYIYARQA